MVKLWCCFLRVYSKYYHTCIWRLYRDFHLNSLKYLPYFCFLKLFSQVILKIKPGLYYINKKEIIPIVKINKQNYGKNTFPIKKIPNPITDHTISQKFIPIHKKQSIPFFQAIVRITPTFNTLHLHKGQIICFH